MSKNSYSQIRVEFGNNRISGFRVKWIAAKSPSNKPFPLPLVAAEECLFSDSELFDQLAIAGQVVFLQVIQQALTLTNQTHQATVSRKILFVHLQVGADLADPFRELGNLTFNRSGIGSLTTEFCEDLACFFFSKRHLCLV